MAKSGPKDVNPSSRGSSPTHVVAGGPGHSFAQQPIPGPTSPGQPIAMKKALAKKSPRGVPLRAKPGRCDNQKETQSMPSFLNSDGSFLPTQVYTPAPATGTTIRLTAGTNYVKQAGTLAALTALMPSNPKVGMVVGLVPGATITTLTLQTDAGGAIAGAPTAGVANTAINMVWTGTAWVRRL